MTASLHLLFLSSQLFYFSALVVKPTPYRPLFIVPVALVAAYFFGSALQYRTQLEYAYACAIVAQLFYASDYILITDIQRQFVQRGQTKPAFQLSLLDRVKWAASLYVGCRGVGWSHEPTYALPPRPPPSLTRSQFVARQLHVLAWELLLYDAITTFTFSNPSFARDGHSIAADGYFSRVVNVLAFAFAGVPSIDVPHRLSGILCVLAGIMEPQDWVPLFGSFFHAYTLRNFWGRVWHQSLRRVGVSHGRFLAYRVFRLKKGSTASFLVQVYITFLLSGLVHLAGDYALVGRLSSCRGLHFFLSQAVAITVESVVLSAAQKLSISYPCRWLGYLWVLAWFTYTLPQWVDPLLRAGLSEASSNLGFFSWANTVPSVYKLRLRLTRVNHSSRILAFNAQYRSLAMSIAANSSILVIDKFPAFDLFKHHRLVLIKFCLAAVKHLVVFNDIYQNQTVLYGLYTKRKEDEAYKSHQINENSYLEVLGDAYHEPETLDIHRASKHGLNGLPQLSIAVFSPTSRVIVDAAQSPVIAAKPVFEPLITVKDLPTIPPTPLLPSTPAFEDSLSIPYDALPSPCTPSLVYSSPVLLSPTSDASSATLNDSRIMKVEELKLLHFLSKGACGQVYRAKDMISNRQLALKVMRKVDNVFKNPAAKQMLIDEKKIMASLQGCDWFVQLEASWHDSNNIYFAMTYYPTDIESEIIRCEGLPATRARFYMIELIIALEELHKRGIVHRDVKAANVLLRWDGHIVLADFGLAKDFGRKTTIAERSYQPYWPYKTEDDVCEAPRRSPQELTFVSDEWCGSEIEMAPEIVLQEYYSFGIDFWAATITLYLMVTGRHPWSEDQEKDIESQIIEDDVTFEPEDDISEDCKDFIRQMLKKEPTERLRIGLDMTSHPYFAGVDWVAMQNRAVPAPWIPDFMTGHFYDEEWGAINHFEPGLALRKDNDDLPSDFLFTSSKMQQSTPVSPALAENPLGNLFDFENVDDGDDSYNLDLEEDDEVDKLAHLVRQVNVQTPVLSSSVSHASMSPSFHSASQLHNIRVSECAIEPTLETVAECTECTVEPAVAASLDYTASSEYTGKPILATREVDRYQDVVEPVKGRTERDTNQTGLYAKVVSWLKNLLPWAAKSASNVTCNVTLTQAVQDDLSVWESIKWSFRKMWVPKVKQLHGPQRKRSILI
ncbi:hypothetical protein AX17_001724 [Amanita inopinata Kibby_2008]|nr:hypothetical protein AX17_001724 [Amanita inopinata Kibby_2008]